MSIQYQIDVTRRLVTSICSGVVDDEDMLNWASAIVADSAVAFGMSRMYELKRGDPPRPFCVFRTFDDAMKWLDDPEPLGAS